jgi:hypothetical protein
MRGVVRPARALEADEHGSALACRSGGSEGADVRVEVRNAATELPLGTRAAGGARAALLDFYPNNGRKTTLQTASDLTFEDLVAEGLEGARKSARKCAGPRTRLLSSSGRVIEVPCRRNYCAACHGRKVSKWAERLRIDAQIEPPTYALTLTTVWTEWDRRGHYLAEKHLLEALRNRFGRQVERAETLEQTTGLSRTSGGFRRGHAHLLLKGIEPGRARELERFVRRFWKRAIGADQVKADELKGWEGVVAYIGLEHGKEAQAPTGLPKGTRIVRATRGYWSRPPAELDAIAKERRQRHRAAQEVAKAYRARSVDQLARKELVEMELQAIQDERWFWLRPELQEGAAGGVGEAELFEAEPALVELGRLVEIERERAVDEGRADKTARAAASSLKRERPSLSLARSP